MRWQNIEQYLAVMPLCEELLYVQKQILIKNLVHWPGWNEGAAFVSSV